MGKTAGRRRRRQRTKETGTHCQRLTNQGGFQAVVELLVRTQHLLG